MKISQLLCLLSVDAVAAQPNAHDADWIHAPLRLAEELKSGNLRSRRHASQSLLSEQGKTVEGSATSKIVGEIGFAEEALRKELQGHPDVLSKEESLLRQASSMARRAGQFQKQASLLKSKVMEGKTQIVSSQTQKTSSAVQLKSLERAEKALVSDGVDILHATKDLKVNVVEAIGESNPATAAQVEKLLDTVGQDQTKIIHGEKGLVHGIDHALAEEAAVTRRHKTSQKSHEMAHEVASATTLAHADEAVLQGAEKVKSQVSSILGKSETSAQVENLMSQIESIQQTVISSDKDAVNIDQHLMKEPVFHKKMTSVHPAAERHVLAQESKQASASNAAMLAHLDSQARALQSIAKKREGMVSESRHLLAETDRAQAALEEQLGGTEAGTEIAEILEKAQAEERKAAVGAKKQAALANQQVATAKDLVKQLKSLA